VENYYLQIFSLWLPYLVRSKSIKTVQLKLEEVRNLCLRSREIFMSQPTLLELDAPLTICGKFQFMFCTRPHSLHC